MLAALVGFSGTSPSVLPDKPTKDESALATRSLPGQSKNTTKGRVVDPDGKPVAGAIVTVARFRQAGIGPYGWEADRQQLDETVTDNEGRFTLKSGTFEAVKPDDPEEWRLVLAVARAPGFGPAWIVAGSPLLATINRSGCAHDDAPINGRIVDLEGRPVAGVTIKVDSLWEAKSTDAIDRWQKDVALTAAPGDRPRSHYFPIDSKLPGNEPAVSTSAVTDGNGRFRLAGLGRDRLAMLHLSGPSITFAPRAGGFFQNILRDT